MSNSNRNTPLSKAAQAAGTDRFATIRKHMREYAKNHSEQDAEVEELLKDENYTSQLVDNADSNPTTGSKDDTRFVHADARGGDTGEEVPNETASEEIVPDSGTEIPAGGPRIVINPTTFRNKKDAVCVAWNEGIRIFMEQSEFEPGSEPTEKQRRYLADTPYADDELQLRRTILARIATFDTSVTDATDDQLSEVASVLRGMIETGFARTDDEVSKCTRLLKAAEAAVGAPLEEREGPIEPAEPTPVEPDAGTRGAIGAGNSGRIEDLNTRSMNGPAIKPERAIGDMGERTLTDAGSMNGPDIEPERPASGRIEDLNTRSMNGPSVVPRRIGRPGEAGTATPVEPRRP